MSLIRTGLLSQDRPQTRLGSGHSSRDALCPVAKGIRAHRRSGNRNTDPCSGTTFLHMPWGGGGSGPLEACRLPAQSLNTGDGAPGGCHPWDRSPSPKEPVICPSPRHIRIRPGAPTGRGEPDTGPASYTLCVPVSAWPWRPHGSGEQLGPSPCPHGMMDSSDFWAAIVCTL